MTTLNKIKDMIEAGASEESLKTEADHWLEEYQHLDRENIQLRINDMCLPHLDNLPFRSVKEMMESLILGRMKCKLARDIRNVMEKCGCGHSEKPCNDCETQTGWICTLPEGHEGDHVACSETHHNILSWKQEEGIITMEYLRKLAAVDAKSASPDAKEAVKSASGLDHVLDLIEEGAAGHHKIYIAMMGYVESINYAEDIKKQLVKDIVGALSRKCIKEELFKRGVAIMENRKYEPTRATFEWGEAYLPPKKEIDPYACNTCYGTGLVNGIGAPCPRGCEG